MKVVLLQDIPHIGKKYEVKEVRDGYARNFLLPRKLAEVETEKTRGALALKKENESREQSDEYQNYKALAEELRSHTLQLKMKMGEKGKAFGSVTAAKIRDELKKHKIDVEKDWILLDESIKTAGENRVRIKFPQGVAGSIKVMVESE